MEGHASNGKEKEKGHRARFMGKLFKEKKASNEADVDEFLHGPTDKLHMLPALGSPPSPQPLSRIDTASARRWPSASEVQTSRRIRGKSASPIRSRKGLVVRFTDAQPEIIGEGGDEATSPVSQISSISRAHSHPPLCQPSREPGVERFGDPGPHRLEQGFPERPGNMEDGRPGLLRRTQTGFESIPDIVTIPAQETVPSRERKSSPSYNGGSTPEPLRQSFAEKVKADMRAGEGQALVKAALNPASMDNTINAQSSHSVSPSHGSVELSPQLHELHLNTMQNTHIPPPSPGIPTYLESSRPPEAARPVTPKEASFSNHLLESPGQIFRSPTMRDAVISAGDDALQDFAGRVAHLFTLFRLSTESVKPLPTCSLEELVRAALWWFLKGRINLEATVRDRPARPQAHQLSGFIRQQAYTDLAKALWLVNTITSQYPETQLNPGLVGSNTQLADILDCRQGVLSSLRKLTMSMKRNNFLPPTADEVPLQHGLDASIWAQDDGDRSLVASQRQTSIIHLSDAFPLGDTTRTFQFTRMFVDGVLLEEGASQHYRCPVLLSIVRGQKDNSLSAIVASQDGSLILSIQSDKSRGPTWDNVKWQSKLNTVEVGLPRGFTLRLAASEHDYRTLWTMYDYEKRIHSSLQQRQGETLVFEVILRTFQYFEQGLPSSFPREPLPQCLFRLFEKTIVERAATGPRTMHRGVRIGLNTSPKTKNLRGIDQDLVTGVPIQFGFLRGEDGFPALLLKVNDGKSNYTMVGTFDDVNQRTRLHALLTGVAVGDEEEIVAEAPMKAFAMTADAKDATCLSALEWQNFRVINQDVGDVHGFKTVLSENLRIVLDFKSGSLTDRVNVAPGELKIRLGIDSLHELKVLRHNQQDMTISVSQAQVPKELPQELAQLLATIAESESTRVYTFPSTAELHLFQASLTGFTVLFDGLASSFNISRRRMVVPIYKKWDAATTRLQLVHKEKVVQLVAFFQNFSHGDCINFTLKSTDVFESSGRSGKFSLRIVDAKFAMPKAPSPEGGTDHAFVCLDMPEYPGEHDDITIVFESEPGQYCRPSPSQPEPNADLLQSENRL